MTGSGVVLADEDAAELERRTEALLVEMEPKGELARNLVRRVALMTVKLDRCSEHEAKAIAYRMRRATAEFDDARLAEVEKAYSWLAHEPATHARRLRSMPEGIDQLIESLQGLRSDLGHEDGVRWTWQHCEQLHHLLGRRRLELPVSRARALTEAIQGDFQYLRKADGADLSAFDRQCWAATELVKLIGGEIEALKALRESLDLESLELDRSEAPQRAIFDASKEATLARKYEAAAERGLFRTLREFREVQAETPAARLEPGEPEIAEELGSSLPEPPEEKIEEEDVDETAPEAPPEAVTPALEAPEIDPKAEWIDDR
jgi:hypothetical protein